MDEEVEEVAEEEVDGGGRFIKASASPERVSNYSACIAFNWVIALGRA